MSLADTSFENWMSDAPPKMAEIYRCAAEIFVAKGFDATTMNDIAAAVMLTKPGLYHYVSGKKELLFGIMQFAMDIVDSEVVGPARKIPDAEQRLRFILSRHASLTRYMKEISILTDEVVALAEAQRRIIIERKRQYFDFLRETLISLRNEGKLRELDVTVATLNIFAMVIGIARWYQPDGRLSAAEVATQTARLLLGGLLRQA